MQVEKQLRPRDKAGLVSNHIQVREQELYCRGGKDIPARNLEMGGVAKLSTYPVGIGIGRHYHRHTSIGFHIGISVRQIHC